MENTPGLCPRCAWQRALEPEEASPEPIESDVDPAWLAEHGFGGTDGSEPGRRTFAGYELGAELGRGGMGVVYAALQPGLNRRVALKILSPTISGAGTDAQRFQNEVEAASRLDHPNILPVYEYGEHEGQWFYTMKLAEGGTLAEHLSEFGARSLELVTEGKARQRRIASLMLDLARAVAYAHQRGILHRDLKPANILLDAEGKACVSDFGLAKFLQEDRGLTLSRGIVGTPGYMAPEQASGHKLEVTTATDVYGLGTILYELLTGRAPFAGDSTVEILRQVAEQEVPPPHRLNPHVDRDLETICLKCLAKEPARRYPIADALAADLERWLADEPIAARPASTAERTWRWCRRRPALAGSLAALMVTVTIALVVVTVFWREAVDQGRAVRAHLYAANVAQAQDALRNGNQRRTRDLLSSWIPTDNSRDLRGWEWFYLWGLCQPDDLAPVFVGESAVVSLELTPRGDRLLIGQGQGGGPCLLDLATQAVLGQWNYVWGGGGGFSRSGALLATGGGAAVDVRHQADLSLLAELRNNKPLTHLVFSPRNENEILTAWDATEPSAAGTLQLCSVVDQQVRWETQGLRRRPGYPSGDVAFSRQGEWIAVGDCDGLVRIHDAASGERIRQFTAHPEGITTLAFSPDDKMLATASGYVETAIRLWDPDTGEPLGELRGHNAYVTDVVFSPEGNRLYSGGADQTVRIWDLEKREQERVVQGFGDAVESLAQHPDGQTMFAGIRDGGVLSWQVGSNSLATAGPVLPEPQRDVVFDPVKEQVFTIDEDGALSVRRLPEWSVKQQLPRFGTNLVIAAVSSDGEHLACLDTTSAIRVGSVSDTGTPTTLDDLVGGDVYFLSFLDRGRLLAGLGDSLGIAGGIGRDYRGGYRNILAFWRSRDWRLLSRETASRSRTPSAVGSSSQPLVFIGILDNIARVEGWSPDPSHAPLILPEATGVLALALSPDESLLACGTDRGVAEVWDLKARLKLPFTFRHRKAVTSLAFSPDARRLATSAGGSETVRLWDLETGLDLLTLETSESRIRFLRFSPDGSWLAAGADGGAKRSGKVHVWHAPPDRQAASPNRL